MQGVWVFIIFVCKRNVVQVLLKKKDRLYSTVAARRSSRARTSSTGNSSDYSHFWLLIL